jgi:TRAP-type C4-dicarboxylate transport system permease small subunit
LKTFNTPVKVKLVKSSGKAGGLPILITELVVLIIIFIALIIFIRFGLELAKANWKRTMQVVRMSCGFVTLSLPVVSISMSVSTLIKIVDRVKNFGKGAGQKA